MDRLAARIPRRLSAALSMVLVAMSGQGYAYFPPNEAKPLVLHELRVVDATFEEVVQSLRVRTRLESGASYGVNLVIKDPLHHIDSSRRLSLEVHDMKVKDVVDVLGAYFGVRVKIEPFAIVFSPKNGPQELWTRTFKVPPDFLRSANLGR